MNGRTLYLCARVRDILHLIKNATLTYPSPGDAQAMASAISAAEQTVGVIVAETPTSDRTWQGDFSHFLKNAGLEGEAEEVKEKLSMAYAHAWAPKSGQMVPPDAGAVARVVHSGVSPDEDEQYAHTVYAPTRIPVGAELYLHPQDTDLQPLPMPSDRWPSVHDVKCFPEFFSDVLSGKKPFEVRKDDRGYRVGDLMYLMEWSGATGYTGRTAVKRIRYVLQGGSYGLAGGYVVLGLSGSPYREFYDMAGLSVSEAKKLMRDPCGLATLINYHSVWETEGEAFDHGMGEGNRRRILQLRALGYPIVAEDPELWPEEVQAEFLVTDVRTAPVGTKAPAVMGGAWYRTEHGWKWNGPEGSGGTFPTPGGDWGGRLIPPWAKD